MVDGGVRQVPMSLVIFVQPRSIPKTTSGKIQRHKCKNGYHDRTLKEVFRWEAAAAENLPSSSPLLSANQLAESEAYFSAEDNPTCLEESIPPAAASQSQMEPAAIPPPDDLEAQTSPSSCARSPQLPPEDDARGVEEMNIHQQGPAAATMPYEDQRTLPQLETTSSTSSEVAAEGNEDVNKRALDFIERLISYVIQARKLPRESVDPDQPMSLFGFDSLGFVVLGRKMGDWVGKEISPAIVSSSAR